MVSGGVILIALPSNNKKNRINPSSKHLRTTFAASSGVSKRAANINPLPLISLIEGCIKCFLINASFFKDAVIKGFHTLWA